MTNQGLFLLAALCGGVALLEAQTQPGNIKGTIRDQAKAPIAGATITATNLENNSTRIASSGGDGVYQLRDLPAGRYSVSAQKSGYQEVTVASVTVAAGQAVDMADVAMAPAIGGP